MKTTLKAGIIVSLFLQLFVASVRANTFYLSSQTNSYSLGAPYPFDPYDGAEPVSALDSSNHIYIVEDNADDYAALTDMQALSMQMTAMDASSPPGPGDFGSGGIGTNDFGGGTFSYSFDTNTLWLEITNVSNGFAFLNVHNATNFVYEIFSREDLTAPLWNIEAEVFPTNTAVMPFTVPFSPLTNRFLWARDWTGIDENTNMLPDWWEWKYFGNFNQPTNGDYDGDGVNNFDEFHNGTDPNKIQFTISVTNDYVNTGTVPVRISVAGGVPSYISIVDTTNFIPVGLPWMPYTPSNITATLTPGDGEHQIWIGLRGLPPDAYQTWQEAVVTVDTTPPTIIVTNPTAGTVSQPFIQAQGVINEEVKRITFAVSNAAGLLTNVAGYVTGRFYDTNVFNFTSNYFQLYDIPLTNGVNNVTIQATDRAGNVGTTNFAVTLDYSSDTTPPVVQLVWPQNGTQIAGNSFTLQATIDDPVAQVNVTVQDSAANSNSVQATVYRSGKVYAKNLPLGSGTNVVTITATDAAGNSSVSTLNVSRSALTMTASSLLSSQPNQSYITVNGTVSDPSYIVKANGITATNDTSGNWTATGVPVSSTGTATVNVEIYDANGNLVASQVLTEQQPPTVKLAAYQSTDTYWENVHESTLFHWDDNTNSVPYLFQDCWISTVSLTAQNWVAAEGGADRWYDLGEDGLCSDPPWTDGGSSPLDDTFYASWDSYWPNGEVDRSGLYAGQPWSTHYEQHSTVVLDTGEGQIGETQTYLVRACANEWDQLTNFQWQVDLLLPETLEINNEPLLHTDISSDDPSMRGALVGETLVEVPAGIKLDITPIATQFTNDHYYAFDVTVTNAARIVDLNSGLDLTGTTNTVIVGQQMNLAFVMNSTNFTPQGYEWTVPGYAISNYVADANSGIVYSNFPTTGSNVVFYWVDGAKNQKVQCTAIIAAKTVTVETVFNVERPSIDWIGSIDNAIAVDTNYFGYDLFDPQYSGSTWLHFGDSDLGGELGIVNGINFTATNVDLGTFTGDYKLTCVQLGNVSRQSCNTNGVSIHFSGSGLDTTYPYMEMNNYWPLAYDSPASIVTGANIKKTAEDYFQMFLLFRPLITNSIPVPIKRVDWNWAASASLGTNSHWSLTVSNATITANNILTAKYPSWVKNITNWVTLTNNICQ